MAPLLPAPRGTTARPTDSYPLNGFGCVRKAADGRLWPTSEADVCIAAMLVRAYLEKVFVALEAELVSQPKRNDNMPNEFVVSQSCSRVNAAKAQAVA